MFIVSMIISQFLPMLFVFGYFLSPPLGGIHWNVNLLVLLLWVLNMLVVVDYLLQKQEDDTKSLIAVTKVSLPCHWMTAVNHLVPVIWQTAVIATHNYYLFALVHLIGSNIAYYRYIAYFVSPMHVNRVDYEYTVGLL